uniref:Uncharacterized protein n=1 Tax=Gloeothece verrucosa (strain PCC 7822) TaxID=497965 RepID=E0UA15_GLOV7|nr:hypothetical protein Cyan7822_4290 [Gloeothece verrucosa PCC 7822]
MIVQKTFLWLNLVYLKKTSPLVCHVEEILTMTIEININRTVIFFDLRIISKEISKRTN